MTDQNGWASGTIVRGAVPGLGPCRSAALRIRSGLGFRLGLGFELGLRVEASRERVVYTGVQMLNGRQNLPSTAMLSKHEAVGEEGTCRTISSICAVG
jgi:hypothetical protein